MGNEADVPGFFDWFHAEPVMHRSGHIEYLPVERWEVIQSLDAFLADALTQKQVQAITLGPTCD